MHGRTLVSGRALTGALGKFDNVSAADEEPEPAGDNTELFDFPVTAFLSTTDAFR